MTDQPIKSKRRIRYKGTHPRRFEEKYKEQSPDKYKADVAKIEARGATAAGTHRPIMVTEILDLLQLRPGKIVLDATLGFGGHAREILSRILPGGKLIALDQDPIERPKTEARLRGLGLEGVAPLSGSSNDALVIGPVNFRNAKNFLGSLGIAGVDAVLADLGLSSMQIDDPSRGFSFKVEAPFDLRMNPRAGVPAHELLESLGASEVERLLAENADEPHARQIAAALVKMKPKTTGGVANAVRSVVKTFSAKIREKEGDTPIRRVFQALRIAVNDEFAALEEFLTDLPVILKPGGRVTVLSFHSGEDRRVKKTFQAGLRSGVYSEIAPDIVRPGFDEQRANTRSKSAKLRWAVRA